MKSILAAAFIALTWHQVAQARISETAVQCIQRYGQPTETNKEEQYLIFEKAGLRIMCQFRDSVCVAVLFAHTETDVLNQPTELSEAERQTLRDANGGGSKWKKPGGITMDEVFVTEDGKVVSSYSTLKHHLYVITKAEVDLREKEAAAKDKEKLKDF